MQTTPYYRCTDPTDPVAAWNTARNHTDLAFWRRMAPPDDEDVDTEISRLAGRSGQTRGNVLTWVSIVKLLEKYPLLTAHNDELGLLDFRRLRAIERGLLAVTDEDIIAEVDRRLVAYLTPTKANQQLPGHKTIASTIRKILAELDPTAAEPEDGPDREGVDFSSSGHGETVITVTVSEDKGKEIREILDQLTAEKQARGEKRASLLGSLLDLLRGTELTPRVTFNVYGPATGFPEYLAGAGWLDDDQSSAWVERVTDIRDMDEAETETTAAYRPTKGVAAAVRGRDGTCRGPEGCEVDAEDCQLDHVVNHADGGATTVTNLQSLCTRHHNMKTGRRIAAAMDADGVVTWTYPDGSTVVTVPNGPLARHNRRFGQTFAQRRAKRIAERRAAHRPEQQDAEEEPPF